MIAGRLAPPVIFLLLVVSVGFGVAVLSPDVTEGPELKNLSQFAQSSATPPGGKVRSASGEEVELSSLLKGTILLTFWSPDCPACQEGLRNLQQFSPEPAASQREWTNLLIAHRVRAIQVNERLNSFGVSLPSYVDEPGLLLLEWQSTMPGSFLIRDDKILYYFPGRLDQKILELLRSELSAS